MDEVGGGDNGSANLRIKGRNSRFQGGMER